MWRINRESVLLLAGPRALRMQLAHPLVAAWDRGRDLAWRAARESIRRSRPYWPKPARALPHARRAERRLRET